MAHMDEAPENLQELLGVKRDPERSTIYHPRHKTMRMGNTAAIGFGGWTLGVIVAAACESVSKKYNLYSFAGIYMGPLFLDGAVEIEVKALRDTRSFASRAVVVRQARSPGKFRDAFTALLDFHVLESDALRYSIPPKGSPKGAWPHHSEIDNFSTYLQSRVRKGELDEKIFETYLQTFGPTDKYMDLRCCADGIFAQTIMGILAGQKTTQDHLPVTSKTTAMWIKTKHKIGTSDLAVHQSIFAWILDMALSFVPAVFVGSSTLQYSALSSLDTSLRFHHTDFRADEFNLVEICTEGAAQGRTYSMNRAWNEQGQLIATNNQSSIIREIVEGKSNL